MAETLTYNFDWDPSLREQTCVGITQVVQRYACDPGASDLIAHRSSEVPRIDRLAVPVRNDEIAVFVPGSSEETLLRLRRLVRMQDRAKRFRDGDRSAPVVLRCLESERFRN